MNKCRAQYLQNNEGMINTGYKDFIPSGKTSIGWHEYLGSSIKWWDINLIEAKGAFRVEWYIEVEGETELYALSTSHINESFDKQGLPYGLIFTDTGYTYYQEGKGLVGKDWFNYPLENVHINSVYPELWNWLTTDASYKDFASIYSSQAREGCYPAVENKLYEVSSDPSLGNVSNKQN